MGSKATIAELETLFTTNTDQLDKASKKVKDTATQVEKKPIKATIDGDPSGALDSMDRVESTAKKLVSKETIAKVDADIDAAERQISAAEAQLDYLRTVETDVEVDADIDLLVTGIKRAEKKRDGLVAAKAKMEVIADTSRAEDALDELPGIAGDAGAEAGDQAGEGFGKEILTALGTIPVAGAIIGVGAAAAGALLKGFTQGLAKEKGRDRLQALTGIDEPAARRLADAAGEAYANTFGDSIEANMDTGRLALQFDLIDEGATSRDSTKVIESLSGIADVLDVDVSGAARTVSTMLRTGIVKSADEAFDVLATGARNGVNAADDLIDTFTEYPALFERLGLDGPEALGLMSQALKNGARDSDLAADALKEFQIRATDGSKSSIEAFNDLGLNGQEMTDKIARGGKDARAGLEEVLTELGKMEPGFDRSTIAAALFGTQAEDLGDALFAMDLSSAVDELGGVEGAAQAMFDTMSDNDATKMEAAQRNIEIAADGMKGALAGAFSEPLGDLADWVSANRGPLLQFFSDLVNGAIDFGIAGNTSVGEFVSGPLASMVDGLATAIDWMNGFAERPKELDELRDSMRGFSDKTDDANTKLEGMRGKFNTFADAQIALGHVHDAAMKTATAVGKVGVKADGTAIDIKDLNTSNLKASDSGRKLDDQLRKAASSLRTETDAARKAGEGQSNLKDRYNTTRDALIKQVQQMGATKDEAGRLVDAYLKIPASKSTSVTAPGATGAKTSVDQLNNSFGKVPGSKSTTVSVPGAKGAETSVRDLRDHLTKLPPKKDTDVSVPGAIGSKDKVDDLRSAIGKVPKSKSTSVTAKASTSDAADKLKYLTRDRNVTIYPKVKGGGFSIKTQATALAQGGILEFMAAGGLTPMAPLAQMVPANTWRVVGDRSDVRELYAPLDGSARSWSLLLEALRLMPGTPPTQMADGGLTPGPTTPVPQGGGVTLVSHVYYPVAEPASVREKQLLDHAASLGF